MNDKQDERIIELFWSRDESAIKLAEEKYRNFAHSVLYNILALKEDREECLNDALLVLWNHIPTARPVCFSSYPALFLSENTLN